MFHNLVKWRRSGNEVNNDDADKKGEKKKSLLHSYKRLILYYIHTSSIQNKYSFELSKAHKKTKGNKKQLCSQKN